MKQILINPTQGTLHDIVDYGSTFPVAAPLKWVDAPDNIDRSWQLVGETPTESAGNLVDAKAERIDFLTTAYNAAISLGCSFNGADYDCDAASRNSLNQVVTTLRAAADESISVPSTIVWRDASNVDHTLSLTDLIGLGVSMLIYVETLFQTLKTKKDLVGAATTLAEVAAIDWA